MIYILPMPPTGWSGLEIAKLLAALATPIAVLIFGIFIHRITTNFEFSQWRNQKIIEKRLEIYDELAPDFNDLLCYFIYVGNWKDIDPHSMISRKREIDRKIYLAQPLFTTEFFEACNHFMDLCFVTYQGWGRDAKLNSFFEKRRTHHPAWNSEWEDCFADKPVDAAQIRSSYQRVMRVFSKELGLSDVSPAISTGRLPNRIK